MSLYYDLPLFIWVLILNTLITVVYVLYSLVRGREKNRSCLLRGLVMLLCPVGGPLYVLFGWLFLATFFHKPVNLEDVIFSKAREDILLGAEEEKERNLVPIEDALLINEKDDARAMMLDIIKWEPKKSLYSIALALDSEDSELSHYAASVIQAELDKARKLIQEHSSRIFALEDELSSYEHGEEILRTEAGAHFLKEHASPEEETAGRAVAEKKTYYADIAPELEASADYTKHQIQAFRQGLLARDGEIIERRTILQELTEEMAAAHLLIEEIDRLLLHKLLTDFENRRYTETLDRVARLVEKRDILTDQEIEVLALRHLDVRELSLASEWSEKAFRYYPTSIVAYSSRVKLRYAQGDREGFFAAVGEMKRSGLPLDSEMLDLVRFFSVSG